MATLHRHLRFAKTKHTIRACIHGPWYTVAWTGAKNQGRAIIALCAMRPLTRLSTIPLGSKR